MREVPIKAAIEGRRLWGDNGTVMSDCGTWRYRLERELPRRGPAVAIFGVNPSTATAEIDDQTIRKDMGFGNRLGWGRIIKGNKFAFRATDVRELRAADDPVGPYNDYHIAQIIRDADIVIFAWGTLSKLPKSLRQRWLEVAKTAEARRCQPMCFGVGADGHPRHTLMLSYDTPLIPWSAP